ncbi:hypothetical protein ACFE04_005605 [Oxalis oulophora]
MGFQLGIIQLYYGGSITRSENELAGSASYKEAESSKKAETIEKGESSKAAAVNKEVIDVGNETDSDSESDGNEETYGLGNLCDGDDDDDDDDELQLARSKLNLQKKVRKDSGIDGLLEVLREIHGVATNLKKKNEVGSKASSVPLDLDDEASSEDSYEIDVEPPDSPRRRKSKYQYYDRSDKIPNFTPGTSSEYVIGEERVTNIGWEQQTRPSNRL